MVYQSFLLRAIDAIKIDMGNLMDSATSRGNSHFSVGSAHS